MFFPEFLKKVFTSTYSLVLKIMLLKTIEKIILGSNLIFYYENSYLICNSKLFYKIVTLYSNTRSTDNL